MPSYPNRCQHIKINGTQCGSPALRRNRFCYFHKRNHEQRVALHLDRTKSDRAKDDRNKDDRRRRATMELPVLEDANSIQISLMQIMRLLISGQLDGKTAGLLLYALQTASANLSRTKFEPHIYDVVLDPRSVCETPLGANIWEDSDFEEEEDDELNELAAARESRIRRLAEYIYKLDEKSGGAYGFAPKPKAQPPAADSTAAVRKQVADIIRKAVPKIAAAHPELAALQNRPPKPAKIQQPPSTDLPSNQQVRLEGSSENETSMER